MVDLDTLIQEVPAIAPVVAAIGEAVIVADPELGLGIVALAAALKSAPKLAEALGLVGGASPTIPRVAEAMAEGNTARKALVGP